ncbi:conserved hypothetical protein [Ricinus communis]|uniref:Uncharacterized protein n=1 Tax=Ricinus communis TaxID=3988 RepID=B9T7D1_RICCO|nr:conserved hypothetical protein [Ricinus communis]
MRKCIGMKKWKLGRCLIECMAYGLKQLEKKGWVKIPFDEKFLAKGKRRAIGILANDQHGTITH